MCGQDRAFACEHSPRDESGYPIASAELTAIRPDPMRRVLGLTWVGWLNFLVIRWLFVRLSYEVRADGTIGDWRLIRWVWPIPWYFMKRIGVKR